MNKALIAVISAVVSAGLTATVIKLVTSRKAEEVAEVTEG